MEGRRRAGARSMVSDMSGRPSRLFVSVEVDPSVGPALLGLLDVPAIAAVLPTSHLVDVGKLHMTLAFLGDRPKKEMPAVHESIERSISGLDGFTLTVKGLMTLPRGQPGRLIADVTGGRRGWCGRLRGGRRRRWYGT